MLFLTLHWAWALVPGPPLVVANPDVESQRSVAISSPGVWEAGAVFGKGLRMNNPYRLSGSLGSSPESLSLTASYVDAFGRLSWPGGLGDRHGIQLGLDAAVNGISQWVANPSYWMLFETGSVLDITARAGIPVILAPDVNFAAEWALGSRAQLLPGLFASVELLASLFVGAAIPDRDFSVYPLVSLQAGLSYRFGGSR